MVRIAITQAAFDAIAKTLPLGSGDGFENAVNEKGERLIWLDRAVSRIVTHASLMPASGPCADRVRPNSDVIVRLAGEGG